MGEEITYSRFNKSDYLNYEQHLQEETELLQQLFSDNALSAQAVTAGYELEAWLVDHNGFPSPQNKKLLKESGSDLLSLELAQFNIELNVEPQQFHNNLLRDLANHLNQLWFHCQKTAENFNCNILGIGILPTLSDNDLSLKNISELDRYRALNEQVLRQRKGEVITLNINGNESLQVQHKDVMLEAASTSLQIHLQVPQEHAVRYYNASLILSAPMVAVGANAPYLFKKDLWAETRIPVFEQSVPTGGFDGAAHGPVRRVSFGTGYARESLFECFIENKEHFPVLLPVNFESQAEEMSYLRLHNGTIWRWNRPLIGFDDDKTPHLRIEHRVISSAPSVKDNIANIAFYYGLVHYYAMLNEAPENNLSFAETKDNFYRAAQKGIDHIIHWVDDTRSSIKKLVLDKLLSESETGLNQLGINTSDISYYLNIIEKRISSGQTGSQWQRDFVNKNGMNMELLTCTYFCNQQKNIPIHEWDFETHSSC